LLNMSTLEAEGVAASTTTEEIGLTSLVSTVGPDHAVRDRVRGDDGPAAVQGSLIVAGIALTPGRGGAGRHARDGSPPQHR
jgi:hypothetical protein